MTLHEQIELMKKYLLMKFETNDYHGVADAAMDIRELLAKIEVLKERKHE
jgi:hypothetical protein